MDWFAANAFAFSVCATFGAGEGDFDLDREKMPKIPCLSRPGWELRLVRYVGFDKERKGAIEKRNLPSKTRRLGTWCDEGGAWCDLI